MVYQTCLIAQYNEHPYSLIWIFAADKRKRNMGGSGLLQRQKSEKKYEVMPKEHLTSKVLDQHMHACASAQSDQCLWVFTLEKIYMKYGTASKKTYDQQSSRPECECASAQFEQDLCDREKKKKKKKKKKKNT